MVTHMLEPLRKGGKLGSRSSPPTAQPRPSPHLQAHWATGEPGPSPAARPKCCSGEDQNKATFPELAASVPVCPPKSQGRNPSCDLLRAPGGFRPRPAWGNRGAHCPVKESYPTLMQRPKEPSPPPMGPCLPPRAALWPLHSAPSRLPEIVVVCVCMCVCFLIGGKKWKLGYIKDVCFGAQSGSFNEGCDVSRPTPINQPGWTSPLIRFSDDRIKEGH